MQKRTYQVGDQVKVAVSCYMLVGEIKDITINSFDHSQMLHIEVTLPTATRSTRTKVAPNKVKLHCAVENRSDIAREFVEEGKTDA